jgi:hypothetical protein
MPAMKEQTRPAAKQDEPREESRGSVEKGRSYSTHIFSKSCCTSISSP